MSEQMNLPLTPSAISSPESADGVSPSASPDGPTTVRSGPDPVPASRSAEPVGKWAERIRAIYGRRSVASLTGAVLQSSLESRLQARLAAYGSPEYCLTWKRWAMPERPPICALRASGRPISGSASTGWPTPTAGDEKQRTSNLEMARKRLESGHQVRLEDAAHLAGWPTPDTNNRGGAQHPEKTKLGGQVHLTLGDATTSFHARTGKRGALNPAHSRWLMGYPAEWDSCGVTAMQSCRKKPRSSSSQAKKPVDS